MTTLQTAAQQALEVLERAGEELRWQAIGQVQRDLRAALAQQAEPKGGGNLPPPLQAEPVQEPVAVSVDALAQHIRFVDGNHNLGAGILAEKIVEFLIKLGIGKEQAEPVEPVAWMSDSDVGFEKSEFGATPTVPLYTAPPQRKPLSLTDLQEALVLTNLIDRDAIDDSDEYDDGSTLAQIDELYRIIIKERV
jgi:hypothetical protein